MDARELDTKRFGALRSVPFIKGLERPSPVVRNALALTVSTAATFLIGLGFWVVAARVFSTSAVGRGSAELAAMTFIAHFAQLNLGNAYLRFLPRAGERTRSAILLGYGACTVLGVLGLIVFFASSLYRGVVPDGFGAAALFSGAVLLWTIFVVQDGVLTSLREAIWVPVENVAFGVLKLALLPICVLLFPGQGVFVAWTVPVVVAVAAVNAFLFLRVVPTRMARARASGQRSELPQKRALASFVTTQYVTSFVTAVSTFLLPVIIIKRLGPVANAHFYIPWLIGVAFYNLFLNVSASFIVEVAHDEDPFRHLFWRSTRLMVGIMVLGVLATLLGGSFFLGLLSPEYAREGVSLLRWIGLSFPFVVITTLFSSSLWIRRRLWALVGYNSVQTAILIGLTYVLLDPLGIDAPGVAHLVEAGLTAVASLPFLVRWYRHQVTEPEQLEPPLFAATPMPI